MKKYRCDYDGKSTCYISWFEFLFKFIRPTVYGWRKTIFGGYLCPQHSKAVTRAFSKYLTYSDYD